MTDVFMIQPGPESRFQQLLRTLTTILTVFVTRVQGFVSQRAKQIRLAAAQVRTVAVHAGSAIASVRLPVSHAKLSLVTRQLERFELQTITAARAIEFRERRTHALLALARTAHEIGRDTGMFLSATLQELQAKPYWEKKQERIFGAAQLACSVAGLAAISGHGNIGQDAYHCGQQYNDRVEGVNRKIGLAAAFADVAALLGAPFDQASWLSLAMDLACGIPENAERIGAVNFVARKMVKDRIAPCDDRVADKRFAVDASPTAGALTRGIAASEDSDTEKDEIEFMAA
jgi:hypothetical protein